MKKPATKIYRTTNWSAYKLSARNFQSQVNEIHARVAVLNKFTDLGRPQTQVVT